MQLELRDYLNVLLKRWWLILLVAGSAAVAGYVVSSLQPDKYQAATRLLVDLSAPRHTVRGDATRLQQIFWNLLSNAGKFTGAEGTVTVRSSNPNPNVVRVEVIDTGSGIDVTETDGGAAILVNLPDGVTFDVGSYTLRPQFRVTLDQIAGSLKQYPNSLIDVYGHTDSTGSDAYNQTLSENRARTVANYLGSQGVSSARIRSQGFGETMPVADNATDAGRQRNRRVEIKIVPVTEEDARAARAGQ